MKIFRQYKRSYAFPREYWKTFVIDFLTIIIIIGLSLSFSDLLEKKTYEISGGKTVDQLKLDLVTFDEENSKKFLSSVRMLAAVFFGGGILFILLIILLFSYSRQLVWCELLHKKTLGKLRWSGLSLLLALISVFYVLGFTLIRFFLNTITFSNENTAIVFFRSLNSFFLLLVITFVFIAYYSFAEKGKVWEAIGNTFKIIKTKFSSLWKSFILIVLTGIVVSYVNYYLQQYLLFKPAWLTNGLELAILILFLAWMRLYVLEIIK